MANDRLLKTLSGIYILAEPRGLDNAFLLFHCTLITQRTRARRSKRMMLNEGIVLKQMKVHRGHRKVQPAARRIIK